MNLEVLKNRKLIVGIVAVAVLGLGGGVAIHQKNVQAEQLKAEQKAEQEYKELLKSAKKAVETAYDTREEADITSAEEKIKKLNKSDQKDLLAKMDKLSAYLEQIEETNTLIDTAEKEKSEDSIKAAQEAIDEESDDYLEADKKAHQERLDKLKKLVAEEKATKEKEAQEKKASEEQAKADETVVAQNEPTAQPAQADQGATNNNYSYADNGYGYSDNGAASTGGGGGYQEPAQPSQPAQAAPPASGGGSQGGNPDGSLTQEQGDKAAQDASQMDPTQDPNSPWFNK